MELNLSTIKKVFFIGVGGIGISALARMAHSLGMEIGGVNDDYSPVTLDPLREIGTIVLLPDMQSLPEADLYVYSDAWLFRGPEILEAARATGKPVLSYAEALGQFARGYEKVIAIAGVHGKTTTTAMAGEAALSAGLNPTVLVGSLVKKFGSNFLKGGTEYFIVEADDYMRHFLNLSPYATVITNIEAEHLDYYKDLADVQNAFRALVAKTRGAIVCDPSDPNVAPVIAGASVPVIDYTKYLTAIPALRVPGEHNRKDAAAALAVAEYIGADIAKASAGLAEFQGTWRRLENKGTTKNGTIVYDDYAHHPTEAKATLSALRELYPRGTKKITALFQPHLYSRTKALFDDFVTAFADADEVCFLPIYFAREAPDPTVSSELLADAVSKHVPGAKAFKDFAEAEAYFMSANLGEGDVFVTMGAGQAYVIGDALLK